MRKTDLVALYALRRMRQRRAHSPRFQVVAGYSLAAALIVAIVAAGLSLSLATVGGTAAATLYRDFLEGLPSVSTLGSRSVFQTTRILDRNGNLLYELFDQRGGRRTIVPLSEMPQVLIDAVLAAEDASFYDNPGIEPRGIARAVWQNLQAGTVVAGGSTITQQLIRNVLLSPDERTSETMSRKLREAYLAIELSTLYSKDEILGWYLNEINFGNLSYGIGTAAKTYFDKSVDELTLAEAALLAGLPQAPSAYDPFVNYAAAKERQEDILDLMERDGFVTPEEAEQAKEERIHFVSPESSLTPLHYPHWVFYVRAVLEEMYGAEKLQTAGFTVQTTLDPHLQDAAEESVRSHMSLLTRQQANNAALVAIEPSTGEILAMVGSPDYNDASIHGQVNGALSLQQPGSSIKPLVYTAAFLKGYSPGTSIEDAPLSIPDGRGGTWRPQNFDSRFRGRVTLRKALGNSLNIPAVKVLQYAGLEESLNLARRMGLESLGDTSNYGLAFTLGGGDVRLLELASAYAVLANRGIQVPVSPILRITDRSGRAVFQHSRAGKQIVDPRAAFMVTDILSDNEARVETFGRSSTLRLREDRPAAAKTGSTDDYRDSWTMGYTPSLVTGVWVGRHDDRPMRAVLGSSGAGQIWNNFMERALEGWPIEPFEQPPGMVYESRDWVFSERSREVRQQLASRAYAVDRVSGKLADFDTPYADVVLRTFRNQFSPSGPQVPAEYSEREGPNRPWEVLTPIAMETVVPPTRTPTHTAGPSPTPDPNATPTPTRPTPTPTATPTMRAAATPTSTPLPDPSEVGATEAAPSRLPQ